MPAPAGRPDGPPTASPLFSPPTAASPSGGAPRAASASARPVVRRAHPAEGARFVALVSSVAATLGVGAALAVADRQAPVAPVATAAATNTTTPSAAASSASSASGSAAAASTKAAYKSGTFLGPAEWTKWGYYQVQVTISGGKITSVQEVQTPSDGKSQRINSVAAPILQAEAVSAQSANIQGVSGATYTSQTYKASLQAALDQAKTTSALTS